MSDLPSPSKSLATFLTGGGVIPLLATCQVVPGFGPTAAFERQWCRSSARPRPGRYRLATGCRTCRRRWCRRRRSHARWGPDCCRPVRVLATVVPFINQISAWPLSFCHRMSDLPSPSKSPAPLTCQVGARIAADQGLLATVVPFISQICGLAVIVLPQNVGLAVAVEVAGANHMPGGARIAADRGAAGDGGAVHQPDLRPGRSCSATECRTCRRH